jgi:hypothetical protein
MGKRLFWFAVGVGLAAVVVLKGKELYQKYTPKGIADRVSATQKSLAAKAADFVNTMTEAMDAREAELRELLEIEDA